MTDFGCGSPVCSARIQFFLIIPEDEGIAEPCPQCVAALADLLHVGDAVTLRDIHAAVTVGAV